MWSEEDKSEAAELGADLEYGEGLYRDLQTYYISEYLRNPQQC
jgi:hypothetical protein